MTGCKVTRRFSILTLSPPHLVICQSAAMNHVHPIRIHHQDLRRRDCAGSGFTFDLARGMSWADGGERRRQIDTGKDSRWHLPTGGRADPVGRRPYVASTPGEALKAGVAMVHQELAFCPDLSIAENLVMGRYPRRFGFLLDRKAMHAEATRLLAKIGVSLDVTQPMRALSTAQEQLVQIASAVGTDARVIVFDEPTSSLSEPEAQQLIQTH